MKPPLLIAIPIFACCCAAALAQAGPENACPAIGIESPFETLYRGKTAAAAARIGKTSEKLAIRYVWTISGGRILKGQGTPKIEFAAENAENAANITVTLKLFGLPEKCADSVSRDYKIAEAAAEPFDDFGKVSLTEYKARLDKFLQALAKNSKTEGIFAVRLDRRFSQNYKISRLRSVFRHFELKKADLARLSFAVAESDSDERTTLWLVPKAQIPESLEKNYKIVKGAELMQKIAELFPDE